MEPERYLYLIHCCSTDYSWDYVELGGDYSNDRRANSKGDEAGESDIYQERSKVKGKTATMIHNDIKRVKVEVYRRGEGQVAMTTVHNSDCTNYHIVRRADSS